MSGESYSPNMNLALPGVGLTEGPVWASDLNASLTLIDTHNHSAGAGVQINPAGLNINSDLTMQINNLINIRSLRLAPQLAPLAASTDLGCIYEVGNDLYFNDGIGNQIRITQSGGVAGTPGSIAGLTSPASATYVAGTQTFVWQSDASTPANMDLASLLLRNLVASSFALTLQPPAAMPANYTLTLPTLPASQKFMTLDASGNMAAPYVVDNSTIAIASNVIKVPTGGITNNELATSVIPQLKKVTLTGSGNWTVPAGVTSVLVFGLGGGGGGGAGNAPPSTNGGGGGGGGGSVGTWLSLTTTPAASIAYAVGAGGAGAGPAAGGAQVDGATGASTTFGSLTWFGGAGASGSAGTAGGAGSGANAAGQTGGGGGGDFNTTGGINVASGNGGASANFIGGAGILGGFAIPGPGGGGGASNVAAGGAGGNVNFGNNGGLGAGGGGGSGGAGGVAGRGGGNGGAGTIIVAYVGFA